MEKGDSNKEDYIPSSITITFFRIETQIMKGSIYYE